MVKNLALRYLLPIILFLFISLSGSAQEQAWFYLQAKDSLVEISFVKNGEFLKYTGSDAKLKTIFGKYKISKFKKTYRNAKKEDLKSTFFVIADSPVLLTDLLQKAKHLFKSGQAIASDDKKIFEPNDYGLTSTIGENLGLPANLDYLDFLQVPRAWYYTVGTPGTYIGISDGSVDSTDAEFKNKVKYFGKTNAAGGHGMGVASLAAAQGDNAFGVPGVCYNCSIYNTYYGDFKNFKQLLELSKQGVKVINCSWYSTAHYESGQKAIDSLFNNGTLIVAAAGNKDWNQSKKGAQLYYPASYEHVISVSSGMYKYPKVTDNIKKLENGSKYAENIRGYVGRTMGFPQDDVSKPSIYPVSVTALNSEVDILAPSTGVFLYGNYLSEGKLVYDGNEHTSNPTPLVTGTIGLMLSLYPCLPIDEVESILKMTSLNIDNIEANKPYAGKYGAGMLNTGKAVEMVFDMFSEKEPVKIENQKFSRWDFKLTSLSEVVMKNQKFTDDATLNLTSKKKITLSENTILKPNKNGKIHLKIDPTLKKECELQLRDPSILND